MRRFLSGLMSVLIALPAVASPPENLPDNFFHTKLDNGLEVLTIEDPSVPLATIELAVRNGAYTEPPEYDGLSHLYEHMFFKANQDIPSQEKFMERVNELGIVFNGTTNEERVNYFITLSNQKLAEGLQFMNSAIRHPLFLEEEMKKENPVVDGEFQRAESSPVFYLMQDANKLLWGDNYSRKNVIGDHDIILNATPEKMKFIQQKFYYPNNTLLVVAGDVNHEDVEKMAQEIYGDWQPSDFDIFTKYPVPEIKPLKASKSFVTVNPNTQVPIVMIQFQGPDTRNDLEATYAADVFSFILSQQSSKLNKALVESGLALQVGVGYLTQKYVGPIQIFMVPNPTKVDEAMAALEAEIAQWDEDGYFTDEQLETAKNMLAIDDLYSRESTTDFVHTLTFWWASASMQYYLNYIENLKQVKRADIKRYVRKYIQGQPNVTGILVSPMMQQGMVDTQNFKPLNAKAE
ncbi:zinc protease [Catalinimonas alkaloidigena]|uniref:Zinc protease n=1 Tax=Catalinimonas alkaloidigena TaxID=1075417 RepID=A0A1G9A9J2_9BACT|nr:pitrilysin family protein [Catalinimonas alkaloidigena]SDK24042.1 zinc protease [Catalinimonas alkaloidigena]